MEVIRIERRSLCREVCLLVECPLAEVNNLAHIYYGRYVEAPFNCIVAKSRTTNLQYGGKNLEGQKM